jgi:hypothetical protein
MNQQQFEKSKAVIEQSADIVGHHGKTCVIGGPVVAPDAIADLCNRMNTKEQIKQLIENYDALRGKTRKDLAERIRNCSAEEVVSVTSGHVCFLDRRSREYDAALEALCRNLIVEE